jgi:L-alanine-DL-glutamate epimerase-like enolase superfamily enzyme
VNAIAAIRVEHLTADLPRPWVPSAPRMHFISVSVRDDDGAEGWGLSWTPTIGAGAITSLLNDDIRDFAMGEPSDAESLWPRLWAHLHEAGSGGITTIAMAGLDTALWDLRLRRAGHGLVEHLGRQQETLPVYGSGVNLHYNETELAAQVERWVARGCTAVKIKVGREHLSEDVARVALVRDILGPDRELMLDANQRWHLGQAVEAVSALSRFRPAWIEEPLRSDDLKGYRALSSLIDTPIALGENLHTEHRFLEAIDAGAAIVQPNVVRVGGITPFLRIAALADEHGVDVAPHLLPDLSAQLAATRVAATWVEDVEDAGFDRLGILAEPSPVRITGALARVVSTTGLGVRLRESGDEQEINR